MASNTISLHCLVVISVCILQCHSFVSDVRQTYQRTPPHWLHSRSHQQIQTAATRISVPVPRQSILQATRTLDEQEIAIKSNHQASSKVTTSTSSQPNNNNHNHPKDDPWKAKYKASSRTQEKLITASKQTHKSPYNRAILILETLLSTPPEECNKFNLMTALTLTAKILDQQSSYKYANKNKNNTKFNQKKKQFRQLLCRTIDILQIMTRENLLQTRQLCNAAWALGKHCSMDKVLLPPKEVNKPSVYSKNGNILYTSEEWDVSASSAFGGSSQSKTNSIGSDGAKNSHLIVETLELLAERLMEKLTSAGYDPNSSDAVNEKAPSPQSRELAMAVWAYAVVKPRDTPPGWDVPSRTGMMSRSTSASKGTGKKDIVTFEQFDGHAANRNDRFDADGSGSKSDDRDKNTIEMGGFDTQDVSSRMFDELFDTVAEKLLECNHDDYEGDYESESRGTLLKECGWKELSNIAWAFAHRGHCKSEASVALMQSVTEETIERLQEESKSYNKGHNSFLIRDITQIVWSLGNLQSDNFELSEALSNLVDETYTHLVKPRQFRPLQTWKSADLTQVAVALAHGRIEKPELLQHIFEEAIYSMKEELRPNDDNHGTRSKVTKRFDSWEMVVLLWVQARLYLTDKQAHVFEVYARLLPTVLLRRIDNRQDSEDYFNSDIRDFQRIRLGPQEQANLAWSITVLSLYDGHSNNDSVLLLQKIFNVISSRCIRGNSISLEHAHQLWQSVSILQEECPEAVRDINSDFFDFLQDCWNQEKSRHKSSSLRHKSISKTLDLMGVAHYNEHEEDIDVAIVLKVDSSWTSNATTQSDTQQQMKVAVEFDGPNHFTRIAPVTDGRSKPDPPRALGHTVLKYRLLKQLGWTVVRVPYYEFDRIPFWSSMERQRYLQRLLKTHANIRFSDVDVSEYKAPSPNKQSRFD